jgi:hypothetical protein
MSTDSERLKQLWESFMRQWKGFESEWNDGTYDEVTQRWLAVMDKNLGECVALQREAEHFSQEAGSN